MKNNAPSLTRANKILKIDDSKLDRYLLYYRDELLREADPSNPLTPHLSSTELDMLKKYERVYELFDIGRTDGMIRSMLMKDYDLKERQARYIIEESRILYGITGTADKEGRKRASINFFRTLAQIAFKDKNVEVAGKMQEKADRLEGLHDDENIGLDPALFMKISNVIFTNHLEVVNKQNKKLDLDE